MSGLLFSHLGSAGVGLCDSGGFETGCNLLFERDLLRKPGSAFLSYALTRVNGPEKQPIWLATQLH
jgi:hypothetical protein